MLFDSVDADEQHVYCGELTAVYYREDVGAELSVFRRQRCMVKSE